MQKEQEHTLAAIRECLAKNMSANGKAILFRLTGQRYRQGG